MKIKLGIIGTGQRGVSYYRTIVNDDLLRELFSVKWIADINKERLKHFSELFNFKGELLLDFEEGMSKVDAVIAATPDYTHVEVFKKIMDHDKHFIAEKPLATTIEDAKKVRDWAKDYDKVVLVAFPLRYTPFYRKVKEIVDLGLLGELVFIRACEVLSYVHGANFARRWHRKRELSGGFLVTKNCHDFDMLHWVTKSLAAFVSAFGGRKFFGVRKDYPRYCHECDRYDCIYRYSICPIWYFLSEDEQKHPEKYGYDRCVFSADMDIVDHAVVNIRHRNGVVSQFAVGTTGPREVRRIHILGTEGELIGAFEDGIIEVRRTGTHDVMRINVEAASRGHYGGDQGLLLNFALSIMGKDRPRSTVEDGYWAVVVACKAEESIARGGALLNISEQ
ncbi:MAG: hypothetical protein DRN15_07995 [Thermoprotei archaeon]|nr:MAG: hypothetical protein DRN15_07995 [Thermoprotei archaeon]